MAERRIPKHLADRSRTDPATGWPAPFINAWTAELEDHASEYVIRRSPLVGNELALFPPDRPGVGRCHFDVQHMARQRHVMLRRLCQVCTRPGSVLPIATGLVGNVELPGYKGKFIGVHEPWLCLPCAEFAARVCPGLIRKRRGDGIRFVQVRNPRSMIIVGSTGSFDPEPWTLETPIVLWAKALIHPDDMDRLGVELAVAE